MGIKDLQAKRAGKKDFLQAKWADISRDGLLQVCDKERPIQMAFSDGTGSPLFSCEGFGADIIRFEANKGVDTHTHKGDHILFVLSGTGIVEYFDEKHQLYPGMAYYVPGKAPHAIKAHTNLVLLAVGNNHRPLSSKERLEISRR
jgi:mannose-6-phosphate isomerase-like protein (cupin superfamily)